MGCPELEVDGSRGWIFIAETGKGAWRVPLDALGSLRAIVGDAPESMRPVHVAPSAPLSKTTFLGSVDSGHSRFDL
jgi:hypothetical protein